MTENKLKILINSFTIIATIIIFSLILLVIFQIINRTVLNEKKYALQNELSTLTTQIEDIENSNSNFSNINYLEKYAREYYGYGKNGEKRYSTEIDGT